MEEVHVNLHNVHSCICGKCPSFPGKWRELAHADMPGLFCAHGKSKLAITTKGCICADCLVYQQYALGEGGSNKQAYYCIYGKVGQEYKKQELAA